MPRRAGNRQGALTTALLLLIALVAVALIGISPIALGIFHGATGEWERLSFIGQTYGAASAIVSRAQPPAHISIDTPTTDRTLSMKERLFWTGVGATAVVLYRLVRGRSRL